MSIDTVGYWCGEGDGNRCGYCSQSDTSISTGLYLSFTTPHRYNALIDRGWRRSGQYMYKPSMQKTCCPQYTIKCDALNFTPSRSQKQVVKSFLDYLKTSTPGSVPSKKLCVRAGDHVNNDEQVQEHKDCPVLAPDLATNGSVPAPKTPAAVRVPVPDSRSYKTGVQLAESKKKRDFRRLRRLKKIAVTKNVDWETLDVRELGTDPPPVSLTDRYRDVNSLVI